MINQKQTTRHTPPPVLFFHAQPFLCWSASTIFLQPAHLRRNNEEATRMQRQAGANNKTGANNKAGANNNAGARDKVGASKKIDLPTDLPLTFEAPAEEQDDFSVAQERNESTNSPPATRQVLMQRRVHLLVLFG